jgi:hypothetical protein
LIYGRIQFNPGIALRFLCALEEKTFGEFFEDRGRASERVCIKIPLAISDRHAVRGAIAGVERSLRTYEVTGWFIRSHWRQNAKD